MPKAPRLFRHPRSMRQHGYFSHNTDIQRATATHPCPNCGFTIPKGENTYRNHEGKFVCFICIRSEIQ